MVSAQGKRIWFAPFVDVVVGLKQLLRGYVHNFVNHTRQEYAYGEVHENYEKLSCSYFRLPSILVRRELLVLKCVFPVHYASFTDMWTPL